MLAQDLATGYGKVDAPAPRWVGAAGQPVRRRAGRERGHLELRPSQRPGRGDPPELGALWTIEHGPKGGDELNLPGPGLDFGWPEVSYGVNYTARRWRRMTSAQDIEEPVYFWIW